MKDELNETIMKEFAGHCLKMFSEKKESDKVEKQKLKGPRNGNQRINQVWWLWILFEITYCFKVI